MGGGAPQDSQYIWQLLVLQRVPSAAGRALSVAWGDVTLDTPVNIQNLSGHGWGLVGLRTRNRRRFPLQKSSPLASSSSHLLPIPEVWERGFRVGHTPHPSADGKVQVWSMRGLRKGLHLHVGSELVVSW